MFPCCTLSRKLAASGRHKSDSVIKHSTHRSLRGAAHFLKVQTATCSVCVSLPSSKRYRTTLPDAYERLILDVINGDKRLFIRNDELEVRTVSRASAEATRWMRARTIADLCGHRCTVLACLESHWTPPIAGILLVSAAPVGHQTGRASQPSRVQFDPRSNNCDEKLVG